MDEKRLQVVVGKRQILRLAKENALAGVQIAVDAQPDYTASIVLVAKQNNLQVEIKGTMKEISEAYGIDVPSGAVGFLKD